MEYRGGIPWPAKCCADPNALLFLRASCLALLGAWTILFLTANLIRDDILMCRAGTAITTCP